MAIRTPPVYANRPWLWLSTDDVRLYEWLRGIACRVRHSSRSRRHVERSVDFGCRTPWPCRRSQRFSGCRIRTLTRDNRSGARGAKRQRYRSEPMSRREIRGGDVPGADGRLSAWGVPGRRNSTASTDHRGRARASSLAGRCHSGSAPCAYANWLRTANAAAADREGRLSLPRMLATCPAAVRRLM